MYGEVLIPVAKQPLSWPSCIIFQPATPYKLNVCYVDRAYSGYEGSLLNVMEGSFSVQHWRKLRCASTQSQLLRFTAQHGAKCMYHASVRRTTCSSYLDASFCGRPLSNSRFYVSLCLLSCCSSAGMGDAMAIMYIEWVSHCVAIISCARQLHAIYIHVLGGAWWC